MIPNDGPHVSFAQFLSSLPDQVKQAHQKTLEQLKPWFDKWLESMNLVTREEFEVQQKILERLVQDIETLKGSSSD